MNKLKSIKIAGMVMLVGAIAPAVMAIRLS